LAARERDLQKWEPSSDVPLEMSLEESGNSTDWDQFEVNARLYGTTSSYDENLYTTKINRDHPSYKEREEKAAKLAREIEQSNAMNSHVAEERGLVDDSGLDEEEKLVPLNNKTLIKPNKLSDTAVFDEISPLCKLVSLISTRHLLVDHLQGNQLSLGPP
jgi:hypothetical protein